MKYDDLAASHPKLARGSCWCRICGGHQRVDGAACLRIGWPRCCGYTMTIDPPEEWAARPGEGTR
jgi:hypothetical protein